MSKTSIKIAVSAGELSGDQHAAELINAIQQEYSDYKVDIAGMGGQALKAAGMRTIVDSEKYGAINGFNPIKILGAGLFSFIRMMLFIYRFRPQILILIDYPDFNLRLARFAKIFGVQTYYFIPPKIWAWREGRVKSFHRYIDHTLAIFPFEKDFFLKNNYQKVDFVGHPFHHTLKGVTKDNFKRDKFLRSLGLVSCYPTVAVLPGSRKSEIKRHLKTVVASLKELKEQIPELQAVITIAPNLNAKAIAKKFRKSDWIKVTQADSREVMLCCDAGILKSGTCNLEAAFLNLPFVCFYKVSTLNAWIARKFVKIKEFSLANDVRSGTVKELIQENATPHNIANEVQNLIYSKTYRTKMLNDFKEIRSALKIESSELNAYQRAAKKIKKVAKVKESVSLVKRLFQNLKPYKKHFLIALGCMVVFGATDGALPLIVKYFLDDVFASQDLDMLYVLPVMLVFIALIRASSGFTQEYMMAKIGHNIVKDFRNQMHQHLLKLNPDYFSQNSSGSLLARFTSDVMLVKDFLTQSTAAVIRDTIRIIALICAALYLDPTLALIALIAFPIGIVPIYNFGRRIRKLSKRGQEEIGSISSLVQETVLGNRVIKIFNQEEREQAKFEEHNEKLTRTFIKSEKNRALSNPVNEILAVLAVCAVILYGGHSVISGARSQGEFIAFLVSVFLLYDPFKKLSKVYHHMQQGASGAERMFEVLDQTPSILDPKDPKPFPNNIEIEFKDLDFEYKTANVQALQGINLKIEPGQKIALVGFSGAGKTTLVDLLPRFIDPTRGEVLIGGTNIKDFSLKELREQIAMVNQHTFLFNDTIFNNIAYGSPDASHEEVEKAAKAAYAHNFITQLPLGYNTNIGEDGASLSGGERQRIAIARAILKNSPILILDEATAALDNQSESEVQKALEQLESGRTAIIIAHRLSTVRNADLIVVMEDGQIVETGNHQDLIGKGGLYLKLHDLQFRDRQEHVRVQQIN